MRVTSLEPDGNVTLAKGFSYPFYIIYYQGIIKIISIIYYLILRMVENIVPSLNSGIACVIPRILKTSRK